MQSGSDGLVRIAVKKKPFSDGIVAIHLVPLSLLLPLGGDSVATALSHRAAACACSR